MVRINFDDEILCDLYCQFKSFNKVSEYLDIEYNTKMSATTIRRRLIAYITRMGINYNDFLKAHQSKFSKKYPDPLVRKWMELFSNFLSFTSFSKFLDSHYSINIDPHNLRKRFRKYCEKHNIDFNNWLDSISAKRLHHFSDTEIDFILECYKSIKTYDGTIKYLTSINYKNIPSSKTIKRWIISRMESDGELSLNPKSLYTPDFGKYLFLLYKAFRSSEAVSSYLALSNVRCSPVTIRKYIHRYCVENKIDYNLFIRKYRNYRNLPFPSIASKFFKAFYERFGSYEEVRKFLFEKGFVAVPTINTMIKYVKKLFSTDDEYNNWRIKYSTSNFSIEDIKFWIALYEKLGSFNSIRNYILRNNLGRVPSRTTIKSKIKQYFDSLGISFDDWVEKFRSDLNFSVSTRVGKLIHPVLELIFVSYFLQKKINVFFEVGPDLVLLHNYNNFKQIIIDFTISSGKTVIRQHLIRGYQCLDRLLIVVILFANSVPSFDFKDIPFLNSVLFLSFSDFLLFFRFPPSIVDKFLSAVNLAKRSLYDEDYYEQLFSLSLEATDSLNFLSSKHNLQDYSL